MEIFPATDHFNGPNEMHWVIFHVWVCCRGQLRAFFCQMATSPLNPKLVSHAYWLEVPPLETFPATDHFNGPYEMHWFIFHVWICCCGQLWAFFCQLATSPLNPKLVSHAYWLEVPPMETFPATDHFNGPNEMHWVIFHVWMCCRGQLWAFLCRWLPVH